MLYNDFLEKFLVSKMPMNWFGGIDNSSTMNIHQSQQELKKNVQIKNTVKYKLRNQKMMMEKINQC